MEVGRQSPQRKYREHHLSLYVYEISPKVKAEAMNHQVILVKIRSIQ